MDLSLIIVSRNTSALLRQCLQSVTESIEGNISYEVVVIDNGSSDDSCAVVQEHFPKVRLIRNPENRGFARANNQGVAAAVGQYLLFLNPDTVMHAGSVETMLDFMRRTSSAGAATCRVELADGNLDDACHRGFPTPWNALCHFSGLAALFPRSRLFAGYSRGWEDTSQVHEIDALAGAYMLVRREAGHSVGWWDEDYFFYGDDIDFCYRLKKGGWRIYFVPATTVLHYKGTSSGIRRESRHIATADRLMRREATIARFEAMRIFYRKHDMANRFPLLTFVVFAAIEIKERIALWSVGRA